MHTLVRLLRLVFKNSLGLLARQVWSRPLRHTRFENKGLIKILEPEKQGKLAVQYVSKRVASKFIRWPNVERVLKFRRQQWGALKDRMGDQMHTAS